MEGGDLFEDAITCCLSDDNDLRSNKMNSIPVNFDYVRFSLFDGKPYFWDPNYPQWIQFVENGAWVSNHVLSVKQYVFYNAFHLTQIGLIPNREIMDKKMKKIVEEAEKLLSQYQRTTETSGPSPRPTLPSLQSYHAKILSELPCHEPVGKRRTPQRRLLPASNSGSSVSARKHPYSQAPSGQTQPRDGTTSGPYPRLDYYSM